MLIEIEPPEALRSRDEIVPIRPTWSQLAACEKRSCWGLLTERPRSVTVDVGTGREAVVHKYHPIGTLPLC